MHEAFTHSPMAKSIRSKVKRSFRSNKRESGKYAVAHAARLNRLNAKLAAVKATDRPIAAPLDSDTAEEMVAEDHPQGSSDSEAFFACLGLLHPRRVTPQNLARCGFRGGP